MIIAGIVIGATGAFFSDTEISQENKFEVGSIDLSIEDASSTVPLSFSSMQPYERKSDFINVRNVGTLPFELSMNFENTENEGEADLSEILEGEIFIERDLLYYIYNFKDPSLQLGSGQVNSGQGLSSEEWLDKFIQKVQYLIDSDSIGETEGQDLIEKAESLREG